MAIPLRAGIAAFAKDGEKLEKGEGYADLKNSKGEGGASFYEGGLPGGDLDECGLQRIRVLCCKGGVRIFS